MYIWMLLNVLLIIFIKIHNILEFKLNINYKYVLLQFNNASYKYLIRMYNIDHKKKKSNYDIWL